MNKPVRYFAFFLLFGITLFWQCKDEPVEPKKTETEPFKGHLAIICNEGNLGSGNASVTSLNLTNNTVSQDVFTTKNNRPLGDVLQSACYYNGNIYMVVNNSHKIEICAANDFAQQGVIEGLSQPRYMITKDGKGYVTQWGEANELGISNGAVKVIDLESKTIMATISTGKGSEGLLTVGNEIWVANGGGFDTDSTVMTIANGLKTDTIFVGYNPTSMVTNTNGNIWVLCAGKFPVYNRDRVIIKPGTTSALYKISPNHQILETVTISPDIHPSNLQINSQRNKLYYLGTSGIFEVDINNPAISATPSIGSSKNFYGFSIDTNNDRIYAFDAGNYTLAGTCYIYNLSGSELVHFQTGIIPNSALFIHED